MHASGEGEGGGGGGEGGGRRAKKKKKERKKEKRKKRCKMSYSTEINHYEFDPKMSLPAKDLACDKTRGVMPEDGICCKSLTLPDLHHSQRPSWWQSSKSDTHTQQKHTQHAPSTKTECGYLNGRIRKNIIQNGEPQRYSWGTQKKKKKKQRWASLQTT